MTNEQSSKRARTAFFVILIALSAAAEWVIISRQNEMMYLVLMWIPALAAFIGAAIAYRAGGARFRLKPYLAGVGFRRCRFRLLLLGFLLPLVYLSIPYAIYWIIRPDSLRHAAPSIPRLLLSMAVSGVIGTLLSLPSALGEEIGWRGFMVPEFYKRLGLNKTLVCSGLIWCAWHLPILIFSDYMSGTPLWYRVPAFVLCIFPVGVMAGLLAIETGSVWPSVMLHAAHNELDQAIFGIITVAENKMYYVSETGVLTIVCAWVLALIMYRRFCRKRG